MICLRGTRHKPERTRRSRSDCPSYALDHHLSLGAQTRLYFLPTTMEAAIGRPPIFVKLLETVCLKINYCIALPSCMPNGRGSIGPSTTIITQRVLPTICKIPHKIPPAAFDCYRRLRA